MKKKIETINAGGNISNAENRPESGNVTVENASSIGITQPNSTGIDPILEKIQHQDAVIADLTKRSTELEGTLKELLTYLQKQQGVQTDPAQPQQQSQGGGTLETIGGILQTVMKQNQSDTPSLAQQLAEMQIENMRLTNQYIMKRMIGDAPEATIQHTTVG